MSLKTFRFGVVMGVFCCLVVNVHSHAGVWVEQKRIQASDGASGDYFGNRLELCCDTLISAAPLAEAAYIFEKDAGGADNWGEIQKIVPSSPNARFFGVASISGEYCAIAAPEEEGNKGYVYLYKVPESGTLALLVIMGFVGVMIRPRR